MPQRAGLPFSHACVMIRDRNRQKQTTRDSDQKGATMDKSIYESEEFKNAVVHAALERKEEFKAFFFEILSESAKDVSAEVNEKLKTIFR